MKYIKLLSISVLSVLVFLACDPIEDESLRDKYVKNLGTPITTAELDAAITISQPYPNQDGVVEGDQIVVVKNTRTDVGGNWHFGWSVGEKIIGSDSYTIKYESNGTYQIYYQGISEGKIVSSTPVTITVSNILDPWAAMLTGAVDKADNAAQKTWGFRQDIGLVCDMCAHGWWKYASAGYTPESFAGITWWASVSVAAAGDQRMTFEYKDSKVTMFNADGSKRSEGSFAFIHEVPEQDVLGWFVCTTQIPGYMWDDNGQAHGKDNKFYLLTLTNKYMTLYHTQVVGGSDWGDCGWRVVYEAKQ